MKTTVWPEPLPGQTGAARTQVSRRTARICIQKERDMRNLSQALPSWASGASASNRKSVAVACVFVLCWRKWMAVMRGMARSAQNAVVLVKWGIMAWGESKGCGSGEFHGTLP